MEEKLAILMKCEYGEMTIRREGDDYVIESPPDWAMWYRVRLLTASGLPADGEVWRLDPYELTEDGGGYVLTGTISDLDFEEDRDVELRFSGAEKELENLRLELPAVQVRPWHQLAAAATQLLHKADAAQELLNDREWTLLPLMKEIAILCGWHGGDRKAKFPLLRERFSAELRADLDRMERGEKSWKTYEKHRERLLKALNRIENLPLWKSIRDALAESQEGYPVYSLASRDMIRRIEEGMHRHGYGGTYPNFMKHGTIEKSRLLKSHDRYKWVRKGTNAVFHIRFREQTQGVWMFQCGTELLRPGEESLGFDSCAFDAQGHRFLRTVQGIMEDGTNLDRKLAVAVKRAELQKLSKDEEDRELMWPLFWIAFIVGGSFFAAVLLVALAVLGTLGALVLEGPRAVLPALSAIPWMTVLWRSLALFGGVLGAMVIVLWDEE